MSWDACTQEMFAPLRWIECHPGLAGYLQAFGAIVALVIAIEIPRRAARRRLAEEVSRTERIVAETAHRLVGYIHLIANDAARARHTILLAEGTPPAPEHQWNWFESILIRIPPLFEAAVATLPDVDSEALNCYRSVLASVLSHNSNVQGYRDATSLRQHWNEVYEILIRGADEVSEDAQRATGISLLLIQRRQSRGRERT